MTRVLVTNDDGIAARGLSVLAEVAAAAPGVEVVVAAPHVERSGASASVSGFADGGRLLLHEAPLDAVPGVTAYAVEATPAAIVLWASAGAFGDPPDLVLSGVNHGPNAGRSVLHSGTVGAALTGAQLGVPALAVSHAALAPERWDATREVAARALAWLLGTRPRGTALSVNVPDVDLDDLRGLRTAPLADAFGAVEAVVAERGEGWVRVSFQDVGAGPVSGSDLALLRDGWATATPLLAPHAAAEVDTDALSWTA